jgi:hypothetical protein
VKHTPLLKWLALVGILLAAGLVPLPRREVDVRIGSKKFTESVILGEMGVRLARAGGSEPRLLRWTDAAPPPTGVAPIRAPCLVLDVVPTNRSSQARGQFMPALKTCAGIPCDDYNEAESRTWGPTLQAQSMNWDRRTARPGSVRGGLGRPLALRALAAASAEVGALAHPNGEGRVMRGCPAATES